MHKYFKKLFSNIRTNVSKKGNNKNDRNEKPIKICAKKNVFGLVKF